MEVEFGLWARLGEFQLSSIRVGVLPGSAELLAGIKSSEGYSNGWIYPPLRRPPQDQRPNAPLIPVQSYGLPSTHSLVLEPPLENGDLADFLIAVIGFVDGVRLVREGWSHFYKAPVGLRLLADWYPDFMDLVEVVRIATELWMGSVDEVRSRLFGAIHWMQFSSLLEHDFEKFGGFYSVLDTLYWIHRRVVPGPKIPHAGRAEHLAQFFGVPLPAWAEVSKTGMSRLAELRNELVHEARYARKPIGFAFPEDHLDIPSELGCFVNRLLFATLRVPCEYVRSASTTRQIHGLDVMGPLQPVRSGS